MTEDRATDLSEILDEVRRIDVQSSRLVTDLVAGGYASVFRGSGVELEEVREYAEGDDPRSVDWNVTARVGRPFVKRYRDERDRTVLFLLDLSASMAGGFGPWSARQMAARVCACLALSAVRNHDKVGLVAFGRRVEKYVPAERGLAHALRVVRDCLAQPEDGAGTDLSPALELAAGVARRHAIVFLMSDFLAEGWGRALARCARRHDVIAVRLSAPELEPSAAEMLRARDPEDGGAATVVDERSARVRAAFAGRVAEWRARTAAELRRARVDLMDVPVPRARGRDVIARPILRFFRMREERGRKR